METIIFKNGSDKAPVPPSFQSTLCSCGPSALKSVLKYWGVFNGNDQTLINQLETNCISGTRAKQISKVARWYGLNARIERKMSISGLLRYVSVGIPIICPIQAWATEKSLYEQMRSGHYIVVVGITKGYVIFQDSLLKGFRGSLPEDEFHQRWIDWDWDGEKSQIALRWGIPIAANWKPVLKVKRTATKIVP